jgi:hypothetical protein
VNKPLCLNAAVLIAFLLMSAGSASARTGGVLVANPMGSATHLVAIASFVQPTQVLNLWAISMYAGEDDRHHVGDVDKDHGEGNGGDGDDGHDRSPAPKPTPEPSTLFSFGVALLIGAGVLLSRRLLGTRK